jgi:hypothetical protein
VILACYVVVKKQLAKMHNYYIALGLLLAMMTTGEAQREYNATIGLTALMAEKAAYCHDCIFNWSCSGPDSYFSSVTSASVENSLNGSFCYVAGTEEQIQVGCRGSSTILDWIDDLDAIWTPIPAEWGYCIGCAIHRGFWESYSTVRQSVVEQLQLQNALYKNARFLVTGYSMGAAQSVFILLDILTQVAHENASITLVNFGQPRVGNVEFNLHWQSLVANRSAPTLYWRIVNRDDIVPHLPPLEFGYVHYPGEVWYTNATHYRQCVNASPTREDPSCSDSVQVYNVLDHLSYMGYTFSCDLTLTLSGSTFPNVVLLATIGIVALLVC